MSVINIPADETVSSIEIGTSSATSATTQPSYPQNVAVSPDGTRAYVTDGVASVWVVDTKTSSVLATVPAGTDPQYVVVGPNGKNVYVTTIACGALPCLASVEVIDTATNTIASTISVGKAGGFLSSVTITPDGTRVYVAAGLGNDVWAIDAATNSIVATIPTANSGFSDVAVSPDGSRVYAAGWVRGPYVDSYFVDVIDTQTNVVSATIDLGNQEGPIRIAITPDGGHAYVTGEGGHVWVVDTTQNALMTTIPVSLGSPLQGIAITPDGTRVYVSCADTNTIYVLGTAANDVVGAIPSNYPLGLAITRAM